MDNYDENPFGTISLIKDRKNSNALYDKLQWDHRDYLEFTTGNHITIMKKQIKVMMPFDAYRCYLSLKNHFTKDHYFISMVAKQEQPKCLL